MTEPRSRGEVRPARRASDGSRDTEAMVRVWRAADPAPAELAQAAKAAFTRDRRAATALPLVLDIRAPEGGPVAGEPTSLLVFGGGGERSSVEIEVELGDRLDAGVTLGCTVRSPGTAGPAAVAVETAGDTVALVEQGDGVYRRCSCVAGPARIVVLFSDLPNQPDQPVVTDWFTV